MRFDILKILGKQDVRIIDSSVATDVATRADVTTASYEAYRFYQRGVELHRVPSRAVY